MRSVSSDTTTWCRFRDVPIELNPFDLGPLMCYDDACIMISILCIVDHVILNFITYWDYWFANDISSRRLSLDFCYIVIMLWCCWLWLVIRHGVVTALALWCQLLFGMFPSGWTCSVWDRYDIWDDMFVSCYALWFLLLGVISRVSCLPVDKGKGVIGQPWAWRARTLYMWARCARIGHGVVMILSFVYFIIRWQLLTAFFANWHGVVLHANLCRS